MRWKRIHRMASLAFLTAMLVGLGCGGGGNTGRVTVSLQEAVVGHGVLVDATGQPVANTWISLQNAAWQPRQDVGSWFHRINTDDQGRFSISCLVAGMQLVSADGKHRFTVPNSPGARVELITK